ncbi:MAG: response regulator transcription factor [Clostridia bacterium]|nr:response regulator transcription factor [Clostridia bacterium]
MLHTLLIIEDDRPLREGLLHTLKSDDLTLLAAASIAEAKDLLNTHSIDLALLDCNLPDGSGIELCPLLMERGIQVIFLTVRDSELDEVAAFRAGAVDYVRKPFSLMVLRERIANALRRMDSGCEYSDSRYSFSFSRMIFHAGDSEVQFSQNEVKLLRCLVENRRQIVTRDTLIERLWSCDSEYIDENTLSVTVKRLRAKLGSDCIRTVYGLGYMWVGA